jgi:hypothetical protein
MPECLRQRLTRHANSGGHVELFFPGDITSEEAILKSVGPDHIEVTLHPHGVHRDLVPFASLKVIRMLNP